VDLTAIDYTIHTLEDIVDFEKTEHDTPQKRKREQVIKREIPSSDEAEEADEAGSDEDEDEDRLTREFEKKSQGEGTHIDLCDGENSEEEDETASRHKVQRFADDDDVEATTTTSSASTTPYSQNPTLKSTIGRTPHPTAIVTAKKAKAKKSKGKF